MGNACVAQHSHRYNENVKQLWQNEFNLKHNFGVSLQEAISFAFAFCTASSLILCLMIMIATLMMVTVTMIMNMMLTTMQRQHIAVLRGDGGWCARLRNYSGKDYPTFLLQNCANLMLDKLQSFQSTKQMSRNTNSRICTIQSIYY